MVPYRPRPSQSAAERLIQIAKPLPNTSSTRRRRWKSGPAVNDLWCRAPAGVLDVSGTDISITAAISSTRFDA
jgi:hypothetical protein